MDEQRLLERMRQGDEAAFSELFARHRVSVYRYAAHMGGAASADDVVQEVFLAFLRQLGSYDAARGSVQAYLLGIARRQVLKQRARTGDERPIEDDDQPAVASAADNPFESLTSAEIVERVRAAIALLPDAYREAVVLCDLNELDYAAAADVIGCPVGTVRSRLHRARARLVAHLEDMRPGALGAVTAHGR